MYETSYRDLLNHPVRFCYKTVQGGIPRPELDSPEIQLLSPESYSLSGWSGRPPPPKTPTSRVWAGMGGVSTPGMSENVQRGRLVGKWGVKRDRGGGRCTRPLHSRRGVGRGRLREP